MSCQPGKGDVVSEPFLVAYGFWHRILPYRVKRFSTEQGARRFAAKNGYRFDGALSDALCQVAQEQGDSVQVRQGVVL